MSREELNIEQETNGRTAAHDEVSLREAWKRLLPLFRPHRLGIAICVGILILVAGVTVTKGLLIRHAIDENIGGKDWTGLLQTVTIYIVAQLSLLVFTYVQRVKLEKIGQRIIAGLKKQLFEKILGLSLSYFDRNAPGRLMARVESDTDSLRMMFTFAVTVILGDLILLLGIFTTMMLISPRLTAVIAIAIPIAVVLTYTYHKLTTSKFLESRRRMADITARITEFLQGITTVQVFNRQKYAQGRVLEVNREKFKLDRFAHIGSTTYFNIVFYIEALLIASVLFFGGGWLADGLVTVGVIVMFIQFLRKMFEPIYRFSEEMYVVQKALAGMRRIYGLLQADEIIPQPDKPLGVTQIKEKVSFENVWFSYTNDENYALKDVSFDLKLGEKIALVGVTGGGKSSIVNLLLRFYDPQKGAVKVDGADIRTMTKDELRGLFGLVLQDIYLFPGDVRSNISLGDDKMPFERIQAAAKTVGADAFISKLPDGFASEITERGGNLSRGERQLLSFARALAFDPQVLILDEATSSVDPETERTIQYALDKLLENRTSLIVAHRLSTILACDRILVIKDGRIIEQGSHLELVKTGGYYHDLFKLQFAEQVSSAGVTLGESRDKEVSHVQS